MNMPPEVLRSRLSLLYMRWACRTWAILLFECPSSFPTSVLATLAMVQYFSVRVSRAWAAGRAVWCGQTRREKQKLYVRKPQHE